MWCGKNNSKERLWLERLKDTSSWSRLSEGRGYSTYEYTILQHKDGYKIDWTHAALNIYDNDKNTIYTFSRSSHDERERVILSLITILTAREMPLHSRGTISYNWIMYNKIYTTTHSLSEKEIIRL